ncbi:MAG: hypothetical protein RLZ55_1712 [Actinomycetota bacterium]
MAIAAAIGPLIGGVLTTSRSWRVNFGPEFVIIDVVLVGSRLVTDVAFTGERDIDLVGAALSVVGMGGVVLASLVWQEGGDAVLTLIPVGAIALFALARWLVRRKRENRAFLLDPALFALRHFRVGITQQMLQHIALAGSLIVIPIFWPIALEYHALEGGRAIRPPPLPPGCSERSLEPTRLRGREDNRWRA